MTDKKIELDVDSIGNQDGLTKKEEKALKEFFEERKSAFRKRRTKSKTS